MKKILFFGLILDTCVSSLQAQTTISGTVTDKSKKPIAGANISVVNSYDGATSDASGNFNFVATDTGRQMLTCTFIGFENGNKEIFLHGKNIVVGFVLNEKASDLNVVTITAGSFEASDEKKVTVLKPLDIVTTAGAGGDTYSALKTLPGTGANTGDQDGLFVRGGTGQEAPTFIDGLYVRNPFYSNVPDIAQRGRFSPFLFKGTVFSTGGYSAQYGEGMSSALILETQDMPDKSAASLGISSVGLNAGEAWLSKKGKTSIGGDISYLNLAPYYSLNKQVADYKKFPVISGGSIFYRQKIGKYGFLKMYSTYSHSALEFTRPDIDDTTVTLKSDFSLKNTNIFSNITYRTFLNLRTKLVVGVSGSTNKDNYGIGITKGDSSVYNSSIENANNLMEGKITITRSLGIRSDFKFGAEEQYFFDRTSVTTPNYFTPPTSTYSDTLKDYLSSAFAETNIYFSRKTVARIGGRYEYSSLLNRNNLAPRISFAYKTGKYSQVSLAYGDFYQKPETNLLWTGRWEATFEKATHYILNFQEVTDLRTFRVEAYYKQYQNLTKTTTPESSWNPQYLNNLGTGYAQGVDVFFRDKKTFKGVDYWISYTYLDTKRNYRNYVDEVQPTFAAKHTATIVIKKFIMPIKTAFGATYTFSSGRPYFNPNHVGIDNFLTDYTPNYNNFSLNASYLTTIGKAFTVIVLSVSNVLGFEQIYGYHFSADGKTQTPIVSPAKRMIFIGMFMSFGQDKRQDAVNNNN